MDQNYHYDKNGNLVPGSAPKQDGTPVLVFGILSMVLPAIFGIIFGAIAVHKAKAFPEQTGMVKAGKILGTLGLVFGIIATVGSVIGWLSYIGLIGLGVGGGILAGIIESLD